MNSAHDFILDQFAPEGDGSKRLTTWYAQGQSDPLGDRLLMFDNTNLPSWEILRFKPALAHNPSFEAAVRQRVEQLSSFQHEAFPLVRPIKRLGHDDALAVVSTYSSGACLSEALTKPRSVEFALRLIRQLVPALTALQRHADGIAHGAVTVDRIILNAEGRLVIREHMVGLALESLELPAARLSSEFGVLALPGETGAAKLDERCDIAQLALITVSLLAGRRIAHEEYPDRLGDVLDEIERRQHGPGPVRFRNLRQWLERALQIGDERFDSAQDAEAALAELQNEPGRRADPVHETVTAVPKDVDVTVESKEIPATVDSTPPMWSAARRLPAPVPAPGAPPALAPSSEPGPVIAIGARARGGVVKVKDGVVALWRRVPPAAIRWATVAMCVVALAEAVVIFRLLLNRSSVAADVDTKAAVQPSRTEVTPFQPPPAAPPAAPPVVVTTATVDPQVLEVRAVTPPAAAPVRTGAFRVSAPIEIHVLDGERVIGSSVDGPIVAPAGKHEYEFVNSPIGYRVRLVVDVRAGQVTSFVVPVPDGTLNINAQPWAAVWLDGASIGETPLGNISVVPGEHEIVFRHPELGERRQKTIVRAGVETRVAVNLQR
jgi:hypothetical protein